MKRVIVLISISCFFEIATAQVFPVDTLFKNGSLTERINLVFLSDGYQADEMDKYVSDVNGVLNGFFSQAPFMFYKNYFNAFAVKVPSTASGANHPQSTSDSDCLPVPQLTVDTYFGSTFDFANIHRLLVPTKSSALAGVLANSFPLYDQAFVLVNSPYYGGSGGHYATSSINVSSKEVSIHEIGHSFAGLADEYWAGAGYAAEKPNLTQQSSSTLVKWANWVGTNGVGVYAHAEAPSWFRPHQNCKMRYLNVPFCSVCNETFVERIHALVNPLDSYAPQTLEMELGDLPLQFSLELIKPEPNTLSVIWKQNDVTFATDEDLVSIDPSSFTAHTTKITATISDNTTLTRSATHSTSHVYVVEWTVTTDDPSDPVTGIGIDVEQLEYQVKIYPNPVQQNLIFSYSLPREAKVRIELMDMTGRKIKALVSQQQQAGNHTYEFEATNIFRSQGEYILHFSFDDLTIAKKLIKQF